MQVIRPILDGVIVRMEPKPKMLGLIHVPDNVHVTSAKIGRVVAVGPGRRYRKREARKGSSNKNDGAVYDCGSEAALVPCTVKVGDRVLFDPFAELREIDPADPLLVQGCEFQICGVIEED